MPSTAVPAPHFPIPPNPSPIRHVSARLALVSHPARVLILHELTQGERDRSELASALEMSETALSQHVEMLKAGGCVFAVRRGQKVAYMLSDEGHRLAVIVVALMQRRPPLDPRRN